MIDPSSQDRVRIAARLAAPEPATTLSVMNAQPSMAKKDQGTPSCGLPSGHGLLLVISGPSGVGKTTITHRVEQRLGGVFSVSVTTRPKTHADTEGRDYYFITDEQFNARRDAGELLEWAEVFGKYKYGTPREPVERHLAQGKLVILEIDVQGALQIKEKLPQAYMLFVLPPSDDELLQRLRRRGREDEAAIQRRFAEAKREIRMAQSSHAYDEFLVNDDLNVMVDRACQLITVRWNKG
jgi:guanylate kinase